MKWDGPTLTLAVECLGRSATAVDAARMMSEKLREPVNYDMMKHAFKANGMAAPSAYLPKPERYAGAEPPDFDDDAVTGRFEKPSAQYVGGEFSRLVDATRKGPVDFASLCDVLDMSPKRTRELIDAAQKSGYHVELTPGGHVGWRVPVIDDRLVEDIPPVLGQRQVVGVISDTHLGSKYCLRDQLKDFVHTAYERGAREILHPGDVLDGDYKHGRFELTHHGLEDQTQDLFETMPQLPGLRYFFIEGNHDNTFTDRVGASTGRYIQDYFQARGRHDWRCVGNRGAFMRVRGAIYNLWHPRSGSSYALSYQLQKYIEKLSSSYKPQVVLAGHWHTSVCFYTRGIHAIACPTFQGGGSAFGKSLGGQPAIGGVILSWGATEHGTMREFDYSLRAYFEREQLVTFGGEPARLDGADWTSGSAR